MNLTQFDIGATFQYSVAGLLLALAVVTATGSAAAIAFMWWPRM